MTPRTNASTATSRVDRAWIATHWVCDGHHRPSVARHQDTPTIEAEIVELLRQTPLTVGAR